MKKKTMEALIKEQEHDLDYLADELAIKCNVEKALRGDLADAEYRANVQHKLRAAAEMKCVDLQRELSDARDQIAEYEDERNHPYGYPALDPGPTQPQVGDIVRVTDHTETVRASWEGRLESITEYEVRLGDPPGQWTLERTEGLEIEIIEERG